MNSKGTSVAVGVVAAVALALGTSPARAAQEDQVELEEVSVTGSRIRQAAWIPPRPSRPFR